MTCHWSKFYRWKATFLIIKANLKIFRQKKKKTFKCQSAVQWFSFAWAVGGKRGAELRGHGLWKTLGLSETHEKTIISLNEFSSSTWEVKVCYFKLQRKSIGVKRVFKSRRRIHHFGRKKKKTFKCQRAVQWLSFVCGVYFIFHSDLRRPCFNFLRNCEILKLVLLIIFHREKRQLPYLLD